MIPSARIWQQTSLAQMPQIMRNSGYQMGAVMQERWFRGHARKKQTAGSEKLTLDGRIVTTSWVLGNNALRSQVAGALAKAQVQWRSGHFGFDPGPMRRIAIKALGKPLLPNVAKPFPPNGIDPLNKLQREIHGRTAKAADAIEDWVYLIEKCNSSLPLGTPSDVDAALGVYYVWVIPSGTVERKGDQFHFTITDMGWCLWDSFDFGKGDTDDQNLGSWDFNTLKWSTPFWKHSIHVGDHPAYGKVQGIWAVRNRTYRAFQNVWNRGEDFVILSDISRRSFDKSPVSTHNPLKLRISMK